MRSRLLLLSIGSGLRVNSVLLPVPLMTLGASLLRKKSSISVLVVLVKLLLRLDGVQIRLSDVVPALAERPILAALVEPLLRSRGACFPYPSWPVPAAGPRRESLFGLTVGTVGSVLVRRPKKPNLGVFPGLGAGAGAGSVLDRRVSRSPWLSGVFPRVGTRDNGRAPGVALMGAREDRLVGAPGRTFVVDPNPSLASIELVRLCEVGKLVMLLCTIGDGPRSPTISGVPSLLGLFGRFDAGGDTGDWSARWANSGGA